MRRMGRCLTTLEAPVLLSLCYLVLRHVLPLVVLGCRSRDFKELEIVLQHELGSR